MGQYFKPSNTTKKVNLVAHDFDNGLKIMEHSYIGNNFVETIMTLLANEWNGDNFVWAGDYSSEFNYAYSFEREKTNDYNNEFQILFSKDKIFIVNYDRREFVDFRKYISKAPKCEYGYQIHPLPMLTCSEQGLGGGDYHGEEDEFLGLWANDSIGVLTEEMEGDWVDITERLKFKE